MVEESGFEPEPTALPSMIATGEGNPSLFSTLPLETLVFVLGTKQWLDLLTPLKVTEENIGCYQQPKDSHRHSTYLWIDWSGRRGSNPQMFGWKPSALPIEPRPHIS
jgi:hypothetical protein